jgi:hypothetical protein
MIWKAAVPPDFGQCVFPWRAGCWTVIALPASPGSDSDSDESAAKCAEYSTAGLGCIEIPLPMAHVNREASQAARDWIQRNNSESTPQSRIRLVATPRGPVALRGFDCRRDALFVSSEQWESFMKEVDEVTSGGEDITVDESLEHLVVTQEAFDKEWTDIFLYGGIGQVSVLRDDEGRARDGDWWSQMYTPRPMQRWCELWIDEKYTVLAAACRKSGWEIFMDFQSMGFAARTEHALEKLGSAVGGSRRRNVDVYSGAWLRVKEV